ncbi:unnamed protein product [Adineta steineri]|uniref:Uncharacterized protein n=1 Tax=Adineta steineri TaxID=433720 RepID=A0A815LTR7_9BILA|nr:unnamed protein product [Adineta steineri]
MSGGCCDLRKRWDDLVGKSEKEAVETIKQDGEKNIEVVDDDTPEANAVIKSGVVRVILDENKNVKYPPLRQNLDQIRIVAEANDKLPLRPKRLSLPSNYLLLYFPVKRPDANGLPNNKAINGLVMTITGVFIGGPANMISAAITADLGRQEILAASDQALSTVTGIVDGTGSFGAAIGQVLIPIIQKQWSDWRFVFYFFIVMTFVTCCCILPLFIRECKIVYNKIKNRYTGNRQEPYNTL